MKLLVLLTALVTSMSPSFAQEPDRGSGRTFYGTPKVITGIDNKADCDSVGGWWDRTTKKCYDRPKG